MLEFITTQKLGDFIQKSVELEQRYFGDQAFSSDQVRKWWDARRFFYAGAYDPQKQEMRSSISLLLLDQDNFLKLADGGHEADMQPYRLASRLPGYLYLGGMIMGDKHDAPFLYHRLCKDVVRCAQIEDIPIRYCFSVPTTEPVRRLLERYGFEQKGVYQEKFPIMIAPISGPHMWQAFLQGAEHGEPFDDKK